MKPEEVRLNEPVCVNNGILSFNNGGTSITYTGTCSAPDSIQEKSEQELILTKISDDSMADYVVVNEWFEYLELQEELGDIK